MKTMKPPKPFEGATLSFNHQAFSMYEAILVNGAPLRQFKETKEFMLLAMAADEAFKAERSTCFSMFHDVMATHDSYSQFAEFVWKERQDAGYTLFMVLIISRVIFELGVKWGSLLL